MTLPDFLEEKQNISFYQEFHTWANEYGETISIRLLLTVPEIIVDAMTFSMYVRGCARVRAQNTNCR